MTVLVVGPKRCLVRTAKQVSTWLEINSFGPAPRHPFSGHGDESAQPRGRALRKRRLADEHVIGLIKGG